MLGHYHQRRIRKTPELYWDKMSLIEKKFFYLFITIAFILISLIMMLLPENFHWQDVIPDWFGLTLGEFVFYMILIGGLCWVFAIAAMLRERRKKKGGINSEKGIFRELEM